MPKTPEEADEGHDCGKASDYGNGFLQSTASGNSCSRRLYPNLSDTPSKLITNSAALTAKSFAACKRCLSSCAYICLSCDHEGEPIRACFVVHRQCDATKTRPPHRCCVRSMALPVKALKALGARPSR
jgi:hypothetical protein